MSLREHWALLRASAGLILPSILVAIVAAAIISGMLPRRYEASTVLYVGQALTEPSFDYGGLLASQLLTPTYARLATTANLLADVAEELDLDEPPAEIARRVEADAPAGGTLITITGSGDSAEEAATFTNAVARELVRSAPARQVDQAELEEALANLERQIDESRQELLDLLAEPRLTEAEQDTVEQLQRRLEVYETSRDSLSGELAARSPNAVTIVDPARPPETPSGPSRTLIVLAAAISALVLAITLAYGIAGILNRRAAAAGAG